MMFPANIWIKSSERLLRPPESASNSLNKQEIGGHDGTRICGLREVGVLTKWENAYLANEKRGGGARSHPGAIDEHRSGGHGGGFVNSRANHIRDLHLGSPV
jgi:hypothetical protein